MPIVGKGRPRTRSSKPSRSLDHTTDTDPTAETSTGASTDSSRRHRIPPDSEPPGRLRVYADPDDELAQFNPRSSQTPEGRLSGAKPSDWDVPVGDEVHLRSDDGRLRLEGSDGGGSGSYYDERGRDDDEDARSRNQSRYRPDDFYVKSTNSHDHAVPWRSSVTPEMAQNVDAILRSKKFPFKGSRQQFTAVALYELIQLCTRLEPIPDSDVAILEAMNDLNHTYQTVVSYDSMLRQQCRTVHDLVDRGLKNSARIMVHDLLRTIGRIKTRELREKHEKRVRAEFTGLIREAKPVSGRPVRTSRQRR